MTDQQLDSPRPGAVLAPLRAHYAHWLSLDDRAVLDDRDEPAEEIRAMQLVLRMERDHPPSWHAAVRLSARAAALVCLDPRAEQDPTWHDALAGYVRGHIRKVTRRARGAQWHATADLPGVTLSDGGTEVRALLPGRTAELDKRVAKLQVGGTDAPVDTEPASSGDPLTLRVFVPTEPAMTLGKTMAQTGHAGMIAAALLAGDAAEVLARWHAAGCPVDVHRADAGAWTSLVDRAADPERGWREDRLLVVRDAGFTEIAPGTITAIAHAPS